MLRLLFDEAWVYRRDNPPQSQLSSRRLMVIGALFVHRDKEDKEIKTKLVHSQLFRNSFPDKILEENSVTDNIIPASNEFSRILQKNSENISLKF